MKLFVESVIFQDSLDYFQQPLAALPKSFGLGQESTQVFRLHSTSTTFT